MLLFATGMYAVYTTPEEIPPPGVETVNVKFPGTARLAGIAAVSCVELTYVVGSAMPLTAATLRFVKLVPVSVAINAVLIGPLAGLMEVSVGAEGFRMLTDWEFESGGFAVWQATATLAVPVDVNRVAGTWAKKNVEFR